MQRAGHDVGRDQVARLMRQMGIRGVNRSKKVRTTRPDERPPASGSGRPQFVADASQPAVGHGSDLRADLVGVAYVCFIVDAYSRMIVGWRCATNMRTQMVLDALEMARWSRGTPSRGSCATPTPGSQFTSMRYGERLAELGAVPSIGSVGDGEMLPCRSMARNSGPAAGSR
jgi:putative transposase